MKDMMRHTLLLLAFICAAILPQAALHAQQPGQAEQPQAAHAQLTPQQRQLFDYCFLEAERQKQKNELSAAYHLFDYCLHIDSTSAAVWNELSFLYIYIKENDKALHAMKKAVECAPDDFWLRMNLAKFHMASRDTENAIREMENIARLFPEKIEAQMTLIALYEQTNRFDKVIETLDTLEEKRGTSPETSIEKAKAYIYLQQPGKAADEIRKLAELYPEETDYRILLGNILMDTDEEEAVKIYREVLQSDPDNEVALYNIALYHKHAGQTELYNRECDSILANSKISTAFPGIRKSAESIFRRSQRPSPMGGDLGICIQAFQNRIMACRHYSKITAFGPYKKQGQKSCSFSSSYFGKPGIIPGQIAEGNLFRFFFSETGINCINKSQTPCHLHASCKDSHSYLNVFFIYQYAGDLSFFRL